MQQICICNSCTQFNVKLLLRSTLPHTTQQQPKAGRSLFQFLQMMSFLKFVLPPALGAASVIKLISSQVSQEDSLKVGVSVLAVVSVGSYFICRKFSSGDHAEEKSSEPSNIERNDIEAIKIEQKSIKTQIQCAIVFSASFLSTAYNGLSLPSSMVVSPPSSLPSSIVVSPSSGLVVSLSSRLLLSAESLSLPGLILSLAVINVGLRRYPDPARSTSITDGATADQSMRIPLSFLQNTLEQLLLHVLASMGLAATLPDESLQMVPALSTLWVVGRVIYYLTYSRLPVMRAFGFSLSIGPNTGALIFTAVSSLLRLLNSTN